MRSRKVVVPAPLPEPQRQIPGDHFAEVLLERAEQPLDAAVLRNVSTFSDSAVEFFYVMTGGSVSSVDGVLAVNAPDRCSRALLRTRFSRRTTLGVGV